MLHTKSRSSEKAITRRTRFRVAGSTAAAMVDDDAKHDHVVDSVNVAWGTFMQDRETRCLSWCKNKTISPETMNNAETKRAQVQIRQPLMRKEFKSSCVLGKPGAELLLPVN